MDLSTLTNNKWMIIGGFLVFVILAFIGYYIVSTYTSNKTVYTPNNENTGSDNVANNSASLMMWSAAWCAHCKVAKPIFNELAEEYTGKKINGQEIIFTNVDCTTETDENTASMNKYGVEGYPTIKLIKPDGTVVDFNAKPTKSSLTEFLNSVL
jgi:thiol-disulfide isomerase/thioredoxin